VENKEKRLHRFRMSHKEIKGFGLEFAFLVFRSSFKSLRFNKIKVFISPTGCSKIVMI
jgi:hypothetical protein